MNRGRMRPKDAWGKGPPGWGAWHNRITKGERDRMEPKNKHEWKLGEAFHRLAERMAELCKVLERLKEAGYADSYCAGED